MVVAPSPAIFSQAAIQLATGPAQTIGVPSMNRMSPGEDHALLRQPHDHVALGVRWAHLEQHDLLGPDAQAQLAVEGLGGRRVRDASEVERREHLGQKAPAWSERRRILHRARHRLGRELVHLSGACPRRDDARAREERIAVAVVAVGVGVDQRPDALRRGNRGAHRVEHLPRQSQVEERVDQQ